MTSNKVIRLTQEHKKIASKTLGNAFQDFELLKYVLPDPIERYSKKEILYGWAIQYGLLCGEVYTIFPNFKGVAIWLYYWDAEMTFDKFSECGGKEFLTKLNAGRKFYYRWSKAEDTATILHKRHACFPHWYLHIMGVDSLYQKKGYASLLLRTKLSEIDEQNMPCYVETHSEKNVPMYEHFGFEVVEKTFLPKSDVSVWGMLRI